MSLEVYLSQHASHLSPKTKEGYLLSYLEEFGDTYTQKDLSDFVLHLRDKRLRESTIKTILGEVRAYLKWTELNFAKFFRTVRTYRRAKPFSIAIR